jgi:hypothetical protein
MSAGARTTIKRLAGCVVAAACLALPSSALAAESKPHFGTGGVSHVSGTTAQLEGRVNTAGLATSYYFEYGPTTAYGMKSKETAVPIASSAKPVQVGQTVTGMLVGYHYRIVGKYTREGKVFGPIFGGDKSFKGGKSSKLKFVVAKGAEERITTTYGSVLSLTGGLTGTGNAGKPLSLQATLFPFTSPFTTLSGIVISSRTGSFTFKVAKVMQNTEFRFVALNPRPFYSPIVLVHVIPRITVHVRSAGRTGVYRIYGTVSPARTGAGVLVQQLLPQKAGSKRSGPRPRSVGSTTLKHATSTLSRYSAIVKLSGTFRYRVFVRLPKGPLDSGNSANVLIRAPRASAKH